MQNAPRVAFRDSSILSAFIKLPFVIKTFVLSIFEWPLTTGFSVHVQFSKQFIIGLSTVRAQLCILCMISSLGQIKLSIDECIVAIYLSLDRCLILLFPHP